MLTIVHDGSYMPELDDTRCTAAVILLCTATGRFASIDYCEKTDNKTASNYRGELLGAVIATTLLRILSEYAPNMDTSRCTIFCDNLGVVAHGSNYIRLLPEKQVHMDLISFLQKKSTHFLMK